jgi:hypothetical protein
VGGGAIVLFDGANSEMIDSMVVPTIAAGAYWNSTTSMWDSPAITGRSHPVTGLNSVAVTNVSDGAGGSQLAIMFTDSTGIYEVIRTNLADPTQGWTVRWMLQNQTFASIRGVTTPYTVISTPGLPTSPGSPNNLNPLGVHFTHARRLDSGEVLVVNAARSRLGVGDDYYGEVVVVNGDIDPNVGNNNEGIGFAFNKTNFGFGTTSLRFQVPPLQGVRGLRSPIFADRN